MSMWALVYFGINLFLAGSYFFFVLGCWWWLLVVKVLLFTASTVFLGLLYLVVLLVSLLLIVVYEWLDSKLMVIFIFNFYFTKKYRGLDDLSLESLQRTYLYLKGKRDLKSSISRRYTRLVFPSRKV